VCSEGTFLGLDIERGGLQSRLRPVEPHGAEPFGRGRQFHSASVPDVALSYSFDGRSRLDPGDRFVLCDSYLLGKFGS